MLRLSSTPAAAGGHVARTGRRRGDSGAREAILDAARGRFAATGFRGATIRAIATDAGVDPALVHHYFGTKRDLFAAVVEFPATPDRISTAMEGTPPEELGARVVTTFLSVWDDPEHADRLRALLRTAVTDPATADLLQQFVLGMLLQPVMARLGTSPEEARRRVVLAGSQLVGLAVLRLVLHVEPLASATREELVATYAPTVQRYLTGDLDGDAAPVVRG
jgi:AcrR family transcriptional regulator